MPQREPSPRPEGWRSQKRLGSLQREKQEANSRPLGRAGRNSGRGWDERGGNDYTLGGRGEKLAIAIDLKETQTYAYLVGPQVLDGGIAKAARQGYEFALQIKFYDRNSGLLTHNVTVISTDLFDELVRDYGKKDKIKIKRNKSPNLL